MSIDTCAVAVNKLKRMLRACSIRLAFHYREREDHPLACSRHPVSGFIQRAFVRR